MHKYAALTALALITMLTPAVSASLTPAKAGPVAWPALDDRRCGGGIYCHCRLQCSSGNRSYEVYRRCKPGAFCDINVVPSDIRACLAKCDAAKTAARH
jgi:hypothetical protein